MGYMTEKSGKLDQKCTFEHVHVEDKEIFIL